MVGKYVVITGSTGGLGRNIAKKCLGLKQVKMVGLLYRDEDKYQKIFGSIEEKKRDKIKKIYNNKLLDCDKIATIISPVYDNIDVDEIIIVNTAFTIVPLRKVADYTDAEIKENIIVNVENFVLLVSNIVKLVKKGQAVRIINIDSGAAYKPIEGWALYCASKAYVNMFLKTIREEMSNIKVVNYEPGIINTSMQNQIRNSSEIDFPRVKEFIEYKKNGKLANPTEIAKDIFDRYINNWSAMNYSERFNQ